MKNNEYKSYRKDGYARKYIKRRIKYINIERKILQFKLIDMSITLTDSQTHAINNLIDELNIEKSKILYLSKLIDDKKTSTGSIERFLKTESEGEDDFKNNEQYKTIIKILEID